MPDALQRLADHAAAAHPHAAAVVLTAPTAALPPPSAVRVPTGWDGLTTRTVEPGVTRVTLTRDPRPTA